MQKPKDFMPRYYPTGGEEQPPRPARKRGAGIAAATFTMFIVSPLLIVFLRSFGFVVAYALVVFFCWSDTRLHWGWRVLAAVLLLGCVYTQSQLILPHK